MEIFRRNERGPLRAICNDCPCDWIVARKMIAEEQAECQSARYDEK